VSDSKWGEGSEKPRFLVEEEVPLPDTYKYLKNNNMMVGPYSAGEGQQQITAMCWLQRADGTCKWVAPVLEG
jgi:hypothetical protein